MATVKPTVRKIPAPPPPKVTPPAPDDIYEFPVFEDLPDPDGKPVTVQVNVLRVTKTQLLAAQKDVDSKLAMIEELEKSTEVKSNAA